MHRHTGETVVSGEHPAETELQILTRNQGRLGGLITQGDKCILNVWAMGNGQQVPIIKVFH